MLHVEITHEDIGAAGMLLERMFGSKSIETTFSDFLVGASGGRMDIRHVNLGDATVLQYIEPRSEPVRGGPNYSSAGRVYITSLGW